MPAESVLTVDEAALRGIGQLAADAARSGAVVLRRDGADVAAVVGVSRLRRLQRAELAEEVERDLELLTVSLARSLADSGRRSSLAEVMAEAGVGEGDLLDEGGR